MEVVFLGTPPFAVPSLAGVAGSEKHRILAVVTQPDRPRGRGLQVSSSPVKAVAEGLGLAVWQPERLDDSWVERILATRAEAGVVVAFGQKIPAELLHGFEHGCINVHPSLLPRYRGAAPIQRAIMDGCAVTGVSTMYLDEGWDSGDLIFRKEVPITGEDTGQTLHDRLAEVGADLLCRTLDAAASGTAPRVPQDESLATYAERITAETAQIDWTRPALAVFNQVRALYPQPGAWTTLNGALVKILASRIGDPQGRLVGSGSGPGVGSPCGAVLAAGEDVILVQAGEGTTLAIETIQPAGKKPMSVDAFLRGHRLDQGEVFR